MISKEIYLDLNKSVIDINCYSKKKGEKEEKDDDKTGEEDNGPLKIIYVDWTYSDLFFTRFGNEYLIFILFKNKILKKERLLL